MDLHHNNDDLLARLISSRARFLVVVVVVVVVFRRVGKCIWLACLCFVHAGSRCLDWIWKPLEMHKSRDGREKKKRLYLWII